MYNNYGFGYRPQGYMPYYTQPVQQLSNMPIQDIRFINNDEEVEKYIPTPNTKSLLINSNSNVAYVVGADYYGNVAKEPYAFKKLETKSAKPEYATKKDFEEIKAMLEKLQKQGELGSNTEKSSNSSSDNKK